jgi:hypothetical protein
VIGGSSVNITYLDNLFDAIYDRIRLTEQENMEVFEHANSVFIVRSADMTTFKKFIEQLQKVNPTVFIYILTHASDKGNIHDICGENYEVIPYVHGGRYEVVKCNEEIRYLKELQIDRFVVLLNNRFGIGFENILEFASVLTSGTVYAFNCYWELLKIPNPDLHLKSLELLNSIANWYWAYSEDGDWEERE